jgi:hypothetical protein
LRSQRRRGAPAFSPLDIPELAYWWRADLGVTVTGSGVSAWTCQKTGVDLVQATDSKRPPLNASVAALNGKPALEFRQASSQELLADNGATAWRFLHDGTGMRVTLPWVQRETVNGSFGYMWSTSDNLTGSTGSLHFYIDNPDFSIIGATRGSAPVLINSPVQVLPAGTYRDTYHVSEMSYSESASPRWRNILDFADLASGTTASAPSSGDPNSAFRLGAGTQLGPTAFQWADMDVPELMIFTDVLTTEQETTLQAYLDGRYT